MRASRLVGFGMLIVLFDLRYEGFDILVDLAGWLLAYAGLRKLIALDKAFRAAAAFAVIGAISSVTELFSWSDAGVNWLTVLATIAWAGVAIAGCTGLLRVGDKRVGNYARRLRSALFVAAVMTLLVGWGTDAEGGLGLLAFLTVMLAFGTGVLFILLMLSWQHPATERSEATT